MAFHPQVDQGLAIDSIVYRFTEHPSAPGMPYGQEGRTAIVYQLALQDDDRRYALKVFKSRYRFPSLVALVDRLAPFASLPGLQVCRRSVLTPQHHTTLLRQYPDLAYAVLMPWVEGPTWMEVMLEKRPLTSAESLALARSLAEDLVAMEQRGLAHCDLSASNVMLPSLVDGEGVALVDLEGMYGPGLEQPREILSGSPGYAHRKTSEGLWNAEADRFAGAVLLAEMLGWCDAKVREATWGESYFDSHEIQRDSERYRLLANVLREHWGDGVAGLFERAWYSEALADCATFGEWLVILPEKVIGRKVERVPSHPIGNAQEEAIRALIAAAQQLQKHGDIVGALEVYRQAQTLNPATGGDLADELDLAVQNLEKQLHTSVQPSASPEEQTKGEELVQLFDMGLVAYKREEWPRAKELLEEVVRQQQKYERKGQKAATLLAEVKRRTAVPRWRMVPVWAWVLGGVMILVSVSVVASLTLVAMIPWQTSGAAPTASVSMIGIVSTPNPTATPRPTTLSSATPWLSPTPTRTPIPTPTPIPTVTPVPPSAILYSEDFEDGIADGWTTHVGTWSMEVEDGNHYWAGTGPNDYPQVWWGNESTSWTDYAFESRIRFVKGVVFVCVRSDSGNAFYNAYISSRDDWVSFAEYVGGNYTTFGDKGYQIHTRVWYTVRFEVVGNRLSLYINDELVTTAVRTSRGRGGVGYYMEGGDEIHFDDLRVWALSP
jgi:hypothetical protein